MGIRVGVNEEDVRNTVSFKNIYPRSDFCLVLDNYFSFEIETKFVANYSLELVQNR
jgi:hypothetical protein